MVLQGPSVGKNTIAFFSAPSRPDSSFELASLETVNSAIENGSEEPAAITEIDMLPEPAPVESIFHTHIMFSTWNLPSR